MKKNLRKYKSFFSEEGLFTKCFSLLTQVSHRALYTILLLFFAYKRQDTPYWAKNIVIGSLGYLISPIDALPDLTPILGYTDDLGVLSFGLITISCYVDMDVKIKARQRLLKWTGSIDLEALNDVDSKL